MLCPLSLKMTGDSLPTSLTVLLDRLRCGNFSSGWNEPDPAFPITSPGLWRELDQIPYSQESLPMEAIETARSRCVYSRDTIPGPVRQLEAGAPRQRVKVWARLLRPFRPVGLPNVKSAAQSELGLIEAEASSGAVASAGPWP